MHPTPDAPQRPQLGIVVADERSAPFFAAAAEGRLVARRCTSCGHRFAPDVLSCTACRRTDATWETVSGAGTVISWVVTHQRGPAEPIRTVVALVELAEGPWLTLPVDVDPTGGLTTGEAVTIGFLRAEEGETVPVWRPVARTEAPRTG